jgi:predicted DNA-binding transcriptional regulator AlpA
MNAAERRSPLHAQFMRRKAVAHELGLDRHTLARIIKSDPDFPPFFAISAGVEVIERVALERWIEKKRRGATQRPP